MTTHDDTERRRQILHETSRAAIAADEAHVAEAVEAVEWERRGLLQTLTRLRRSDDG